MPGRTSQTGRRRPAQRGRRAASRLPLAARAVAALWMGLAHALGW